MTVKAAEKLGIGHIEFITNWKCKLHRVKKMHHFTKEKLERIANGTQKVSKEKVKIASDNNEVKHRGRKANPAFDGIAKGLTCSCGFFQAQHPSISIKIAEKKGMTLESYMSSWKCKSHRKEG